MNEKKKLKWSYFATLFWSYWLFSYGTFIFIFRSAKNYLFPNFIEIGWQTKFLANFEIPPLPWKPRFQNFDFRFGFRRPKNCLVPNFIEIGWQIKIEQFRLSPLPSLWRPPFQNFKILTSYLVLGGPRTI